MMTSHVFYLNYELTNLAYDSRTTIGETKNFSFAIKIDPSLVKRNN